MSYGQFFGEILFSNFRCYALNINRKGNIVEEFLRRLVLNINRKGGNLISTYKVGIPFIQRKIVAVTSVRFVGGKPAKAGGDVPLPQKSDREGALFAVLRQHGYRLRTCSRRPTAQPTRPKKISSL